MKKSRLLRKDLNRLCRELEAEKKFVSRQLGEVQMMHERAVTALKKDRDELQARVRELECFAPEPNFHPQKICYAYLSDLRFESEHILPTISIICKSRELFDNVLNGKCRTLCELRINKCDLPLTEIQKRNLLHAIHAMINYYDKKTNNIQKGNN